MKDRTKKFALDIIRFCKELPNKQDFKIIKDQLIRSSLSVGANYGAACRAKLNADFINIINKSTPLNLPQGGDLKPDYERNR